MKKIMVFFVATFLFVASISFAVTTIPTQTVTLDPQTAAPGDLVTINAFVYNGTQSAATIVVQFVTNKNEIIGKQTVLVPAVSARTAVQVWKMPNQAMVITASIISAVDNKKIELKELLGDLGAVTIVPPSDAIDVPEGATWKEKIQIWWHAFFTKTEIFRINQANYFKEMRDGARERLGIPKVTEPVPAQSQSQNSADYNIEDDLPATKAIGSPTDYATVIFASAFTAFFGNEIAFYVGCGLLILFLIRFLYTRFV